MEEKKMAQNNQAAEQDLNQLLKEIGRAHV